MKRAYFVALITKRGGGCEFRLSFEKDLNVSDESYPYEA
jgi:hypothetical protein